MTDRCPECVPAAIIPDTVPGQVSHPGVWLTGEKAYADPEGWPPTLLFIVRTYQPTSEPRTRPALPSWMHRRPRLPGSYD